MALDMDQLRRIFYEECRENLETLERELLGLDPDSEIDLDVINSIFRAAHSIKGGGATFNLNDISQFTHAMETLLDEAREGKRHLDANTIDLLLKGGDCINNMLISHEKGCDFDHAFKEQITEKFQQLLNIPTAFSKENNELQKKEEGLAEKEGWSVYFTPHREIFFSGNDPVRILRELQELGTVSVIHCISDNLPDLEELEPEMSYLRWHILLDGNLDKSLIEDIFEWVDDECDLEICPQSKEKKPDLLLTQNHQASHDPLISSESSKSMDIPLSKENESKDIQIQEIKENKVSAKLNTLKTETLSSIRVETEKVDHLINLVSELVITQSMLTELSQNFSESNLERLQTGLGLLLQNTKELQESVLNIRMLPISFAFNRFPRLVRDLSSKLGKSVELKVEGEQTELDKTVLERITDPLVHLVRNAVDHGLEGTEERINKGKSETGCVSLNAFHQGGSIVIEVRDDGAGLNKEKILNKAIEKGLYKADTLLSDFSDNQVYNLIFSPGFTTAEKLSDVSGRGVGMDVVKRNIEDLGGHIVVDSQVNMGCVFRISLPLTLAILDGQLVKLADQVFVVPLISIIESIQIETERVILATGGIELYRLRDENIPIFRLKEEFELGETSNIDKKLLCFVQAGGHRMGILLDEMLGQQQVVIKSLESNYMRVEGISGATILGNGSVSLILDIQGLINTFLKRVSDNNSHVAA